MKSLLFTFACTLFLILAGMGPVTAQDQENGEWIDLFNGENLDNWIIKFAGYPVGENFNNTFRVEDGMLTASYDEWDQWDSQFGHIFYDQPFSHYILRVEYRFVGDQVQGGPGWAFRNNGLMLHSQHPETMTLDQSFPVSIETQLLGGNGTDERTTLNTCTPGTNIVMDGELITQHCISSTSETYHGDQWVTVEIEMRGSEVVRHKIDGEVVFEYNSPQLDPEDVDAQHLMEVENIDPNNLLIEKGYISLQAESHPTQFRSIQVMVLE